MCTTGALRLGPDDYLLFKNKDFGRARFDDRLVLDADVFGVEGITTWAGDDPHRDSFSGYSIGANRHGLLACDSNVRTIPDHQNYDRLVELALREGTDVDSAVEAVAEAVNERSYLWGNLVLIDSKRVAAIDVRGEEIAVSEGEDRIARSNHHVVFGPTPDDDDTVTSEARLRSAVARLDQARSVHDVFELQRSHDQGETGICNHSIYTTVYSYVLTYERGATRLHVGQGSPCKTPEPMVRELPLGETWSREAAAAFAAGYPTDRTS